MEVEGIRISQKELHRYHVLRMVLDGRLSLREAGELLGMSYRQAKRLKSRAAEGISGLVHGNRGKEPWNKIPEEKIEKAVAKVFDMRPAVIIERLDLLRPIYALTSAYGHFGRNLPEFTWEHLSRLDDFMRAVGV